MESGRVKRTADGLNTRSMVKGPMYKGIIYGSSWPKGHCGWKAKQTGQAPVNYLLFHVSRAFWANSCTDGGGLIAQGGFEGGQAGYRTGEGVVSILYPGEMIAPRQRVGGGDTAEC